MFFILFFKYYIFAHLFFEYNTNICLERESYFPLSNDKIFFLLNNFLNFLFRTYESGLHFPSPVYPGLCDEDKVVQEILEKVEPSRMSLPEELLNLKLNLKNLLRQLSDLTTGQNTLKSEVTKLKSDSSELRSDLASLKHEFAMVQSEFAYYASLEQNRRDSTVLGKHKINFTKKTHFL